MNLIGWIVSLFIVALCSAVVGIFDAGMKVRVLYQR